MEEKYHILALGGVGMSGLARLLKQKGATVSGEDKNSSILLDLLKTEGIEAHLEKDQRNLPLDVHVVTSSAIAKDHPKLIEATKKNLRVSHRSKVLNELLRDSYSLLVTGTHGKTTTSALLAHVLLELGEDPSFAVGGLIKGVNTNAQLGKGKYFVAEADESDGSFINLKRDAAIVTNIESDHLEYWKNKENLIKGFKDFITGVKTLVYCIDDPLLSSLDLEGISYGSSNKASVYYQNVLFKQEGMYFDVICKRGCFQKVFLPLFGRHNILNALSVVALLSFLGFSLEKVFQAFSSFQGVKRRMDVHLSRKDITLIDDYAHHPTEIETTLIALKTRVKERRVIAVFQPHRSNRLKEHFKAFALSLSVADEVVVTDVYEVGEKIEVNLSELATSIGKKAKYVCREKLVSFLSEKIRPFDVVITLGAGDIYQVLEPLKKERKTLKVALLYGGPSPEHSVSINSAKNYAKGLKQSHFEVSYYYFCKEGGFVKTASVGNQEGKKLDRLEFIENILKADICIPSFHGPFGEDGTVQGFLKTLNIPFASPDLFSCCLAMHKGIAKRVVLSENILTAAFIQIEKKTFSQSDLLTKLEKFSFPLYVKPCSLGSTFGVYEIKEEKDLFPLVREAFTYDDSLIIEEKIVGEEIEVGILGNDQLEFGLLAKIPINGNTHTFETKYGKRAIAAEIPAKVSPEMKEKIEALAARIYRLFRISSHARIDFFVQGDKIYFNEINPIPGMTATSAFPLMFEKIGIDYFDLINKMVILALEKN